MVSIIISTSNRVSLTRKCIESICRQSYPFDIEVIIVDYGSTGGTDHYLEYLKRTSKMVKIIHHDNNRTLSAAWNRGAAAAEGAYLLFLNSHTVVKKGWLEALIEEAQKDKSVAIVGSKLLSSSGQIEHAGICLINYPFPLSPAYVYVGYPADFPEADTRRDYNCVSAVGMLIHKNIFEAIGGFDENLIDGCEDVDLCLKVKQAGYKIVYTPKSVVYNLERSPQAPSDKYLDNIARLNKKWISLACHDYKAVPKVSVVIVNFNGWNDTKECIESLLEKEPYEHFNIILIDNNSSENGTGLIRKLASEKGVNFLDLSVRECKVIPSFTREIIFMGLNENKGFAGGVNEGISISLSGGSDYVWLLNNDTVIDDLALYYLVALAEYDREKIVVIGSRLQHYPDTNKVQFDGNFVFWEGIEKQPAPSTPFIKKTSAVSGASMLIRSDFLRKHGLLREDYFLYLEDNEICIRAVKKGFNVVYHPLSVVYHKGGASIGEFMNSPTSIYYCIRNALFFFKEFRPSGVWETLTLAWDNLTTKIILEGDQSKLKALTRAIKDFILDRKGMMKKEEDGLDCYDASLNNTTWRNFLRAERTLLDKPDLVKAQTFFTLAVMLIGEKIKFSVNNAS